MTSSKLNKVETDEHSLLEHGDVPYEEISGSQELTILESISSMQKNIETFQRETSLKFQLLELQLKSNIQSQDPVESNFIETVSPEEVKTSLEPPVYYRVKHEVIDHVIRLSLAFVVGFAFMAWFIKCNFPEAKYSIL